MTPKELADRISDRIIGAKIVAVEQIDDRYIRLDFEHRGTDDNSGSITVAAWSVNFQDGWNKPTAADGAIPDYWAQRGER